MKNGLRIARYRLKNPACFIDRPLGKAGIRGKECAIIYLGRLLLVSYGVRHRQNALHMRYTMRLQGGGGGGGGGGWGVLVVMGVEKGEGGRWDCFFFSSSWVGAWWVGRGWMNESSMFGVWILRGRDKGGLWSRIGPCWTNLVDKCYYVRLSQMHTWRHGWLLGWHE